MEHLYRNMSEMRLHYLYIINLVHLPGEIISVVYLHVEIKLCTLMGIEHSYEE